MKKFIMSLLIAFSLAGCYTEVIDSGEVGVHINNGKVSKEIITEGFTFSLNPLADISVYNTKSKVLEMSSDTRAKDDTNDIIYDGPISILTKDNLQVPVDMTILYKLNKECAPELRINYGNDIVWDNKVVVQKARDISRQVIGRNANVYSLNQERDKYSAEIQKLLKQEIDRMIGKENCVEIDGVAIKNIQIPQQLAESILKKQQMEEDVKRAELEVNKIKAQAQAEIEKNKGIAEAQKILTESLSDKLIKWKELEVRQAEIDKWNGVMPTHMLSPNTGIMLK